MIGPTIKGVMCMFGASKEHPPCFSSEEVDGGSSSAESVAYAGKINRTPSEDIIANTRYDAASSSSSAEATSSEEVEQVVCAPGQHQFFEMNSSASSSSKDEDSSSCSKAKCDELFDWYRSPDAQCAGFPATVPDHYSHDHAGDEDDASGWCRQGSGKSSGAMATSAMATSCLDTSCNKIDKKCEMNVPSKSTGEESCKNMKNECKNLKNVVQNEDLDQVQKEYIGSKYFFNVLKENTEQGQRFADRVEQTKKKDEGARQRLLEVEAKNYHLPCRAINHDENSGDQQNLSGNKTAGELLFSQVQDLLREKWESSREPPNKKYDDFKRQTSSDVRKGEEPSKVLLSVDPESDKKEEFFDAEEEAEEREPQKIYEKRQPARARSSSANRGRLRSARGRSSSAGRRKKNGGKNDVQIDECPSDENCGCDFFNSCGNCVEECKKAPLMLPVKLERVPPHEQEDVYYVPVIQSVALKAADSIDDVIDNVTDRVKRYLKPGSRSHLQRWRDRKKVPIDSDVYLDIDLYQSLDRAGQRARDRGQHEQKCKWCEQCSRSAAGYSGWCRAPCGKCPIKTLQLMQPREEVKKIGAFINTVKNDVPRDEQPVMNNGGVMNNPYERRFSPPTAYQPAASSSSSSSCAPVPARTASSSSTTRLPPPSLSIPIIARTTNVPCVVPQASGTTPAMTQTQHLANAMSRMQGSTTSIEMPMLQQATVVPMPRQPTTTNGFYAGTIAAPSTTNDRRGLYPDQQEKMLTEQQWGEFVRLEPTWGEYVRSEHPWGERLQAPRE